MKQQRATREKELNAEIAAAEAASRTELTEIRQSTDAKKKIYRQDAETARQKSFDEIAAVEKETSEEIYEAKQQAREQITKVKEDTAAQIAEEVKRKDEFIAQKKAAENAYQEGKGKLDNLGDQIKAAEAKLLKLQEQLAQKEKNN